MAVQGIVCFWRSSKAHVPTRNQ